VVEKLHRPSYIRHTEVEILAQFVHAQKQKKTYQHALHTGTTCLSFFIISNNLFTEKTAALIQIFTHKTLLHRL
jgi:hypothetical protein